MRYELSVKNQQGEQVFFRTVEAGSIAHAVELVDLELRAAVEELGRRADQTIKQWEPV